MLYWKLRIKEIIERYWLRKSKKLFIKYSKLSKFTYDYEFDFNLNEIWDDHISVGVDDDVKRYYIVDNLYFTLIVCFEYYVYICSFSNMR